jgi:exodeoxyribonuclease VII large subunit
MTTPDNDSQIIIYEGGNGAPCIDVRMQDETVWLTQKQMAELFDCSIDNVALHLKNVYSEKELEESRTSENSSVVQIEGDRQVKRSTKLYNLDAIISVGYRIKSQKATQFRIWATRILKEYTIKGFAMDDERLKGTGGGNYWKELLDRIRDIRSSEKALYRQVLDLYATSIDYDPKSDISIEFFKVVQNKLHYATNKLTAAETINERADAKKDFLTHLGAHGIKIYFHDARVEGIRAIDTVVEAIRWFNENPVDIQVLVVTRGGGSLESLQAFNSEEVAKAIYSSRIPVISAIGHENDVTIADLVADVRASTPTDAGKILSKDWNEAVIRIDEIEENIYATFRMKCNELKNELNRMQQNFISCYQRSLDRYTEKIDQIDRSLSSCFQDMLRRFQHITDGFALCFNRYKNTMMKVADDINKTEIDLNQNTARWYKFVDKYIDRLEKDLVLCDPELKLKQGYSIAFDKNKKVIKSTEQIAISDLVTIKLYAGEIISRVESVK